MHSIKKQMFILKFIVFSLAFLLFGCATETKTFILGSQSIFTSEIEVVRDMTVSGLHVRVAKIKRTECLSGYLYTLELDGPINKDSSYIVSKILDEIPDCIENGRITVPVVYLNSSGGSLSDGYEMGRLFKLKGVTTRVANGQVCASACAVAFLGGQFRNVSGDGKLVFHAPYIRDGYGGISCSSRSESQHLLNFFNEMISSNGYKLFDRTMSYCSVSDGWTLDAGAASFFGISTK
jgi:ATP-dependent protease ClpP protease subunit